MLLCDPGQSVSSLDASNPQLNKKKKWVDNIYPMTIMKIMFFWHLEGHVAL